MTSHSQLQVIISCVFWSLSNLPKLMTRITQLFQINDDEILKKNYCVYFQVTIENLQVELGKRDSQVNQLQNEKSELLHKKRHLQKEIDNLQTKLFSIESMESSEVSLSLIILWENDLTIKHSSSMRTDCAITRPNSEPVSDCGQTDTCENITSPCGR